MPNFISWRRDQQILVIIRIRIFAVLRPLYLMFEDLNFYASDRFLQTADFLFMIHEVCCLDKLLIATNEN